MARIPFKRVTEAFDEIARARICQSSSGSEHESSSAELSDLISSFMENDCPPEEEDEVNMDDNDPSVCTESDSCSSYRDSHIIKTLLSTWSSDGGNVKEVIRSEIQLILSQVAAIEKTCSSSSFNQTDFKRETQFAEKFPTDKSAESEKNGEGDKESETHEDLSVVRDENGGDELREMERVPATPDASISGKHGSGSFNFQEEERLQISGMDLENDDFDYQISVDSEEEVAKQIEEFRDSEEGGNREEENTLAVLQAEEEVKNTRQRLLSMGISLGINPSIKGDSLEKFVNKMKLGCNVETRRSDRRNSGKSAAKYGFEDSE